MSGGDDVAKNDPFQPYDLINTKTGERKTVFLADQKDIDEGRKVILPPWEKLETPPDGFRERRRRPKGWLKEAIARGEVADPDNPAEDPVYGPGTVVFQPPVMTMDITGNDAEQK